MLTNGMLRTALAGAGLALAMGAQAARASDPLPGEVVAPPSNLNILMYYNEFTNAGALPPPHGGNYAHNTHISTDIQDLRYIRTFDVDGMLSGVQVAQTYVSFLGPQEAGVANTPFGPGRARLAHGGGFAQPQLGAFIFPVANANTGTNVVLGVWLDPPVGSYNKDATLNFTQNLWTGELEAAARKVLVGDNAGQNVSIELWGEEYFYGDNNNAAAVTPQVSANSIPAVYQSLGVTNPLLAASATPARLSRQPTEEIHLYFPYQFFPATLATITPGLYQSFGGKEVYTLGSGAKLDSGARSNETQLRLVVSTYISPHCQLLLNGEYDLAAHGGPLDRNIEFRVATAF